MDYSYNITFFFGKLLYYIQALFSRINPDNIIHDIKLIIDYTIQEYTWPGFNGVIEDIEKEIIPKYSCFTQEENKVAIEIGYNVINTNCIYISAFQSGKKGIFLIENGKCSMSRNKHISFFEIIKITKPLQEYVNNLPAIIGDYLLIGHICRGISIQEEIPLSYDMIMDYRSLFVKNRLHNMDSDSTCKRFVFLYKKHVCRNGSKYKYRKELWNIIIPGIGYTGNENSFQKLYNKENDENEYENDECMINPGLAFSNNSQYNYHIVWSSGYKFVKFINNHKIIFQAVISCIIIGYIWWILDMYMKMHSAFPIVLGITGLCLGLMLLYTTLKEYNVNSDILIVVDGLLGLIGNINV